MDFTGHYEFVYIIAPNLGEEGTKEVSAKVRDFLAANGALMHSEDTWGMRKLAYRVKKFEEGYYVIMHFQLPQAKALKELDHLLKTEPRIIRYLLVKLPKAKFREDDRQAEVAARRKKMEEERAKAEADAKARHEAEAEERARVEAEAQAAQAAEAEAQAAAQEPAEDVAADAAPQDQDAPAAEPAEAPQEVTAQDEPQHEPQDASDAEPATEVVEAVEPVEAVEAVEAAEVDEASAEQEPEPAANTVADAPEQDQEQAPAEERKEESTS